MNQNNPFENLQFNTQDLYREENLTDLKTGTIVHHIPIKPDGTTDTSREDVFTARTQVMTQMGALPVSGEIEAKNLKEAIQKFPETLQKALEDLQQEAMRMQREEASRIVTPDQMGGGDKGNLII